MTSKIESFVSVLSVSFSLLTGSSSLLTELLPGAFAFTMLVSLTQIPRGGYLYIRSGGAPDRVAIAKNRIVYALVGLLASATLGTAAAAVINPSFSDLLVGFGLAAAVGAAGWLTLTGTFVPKAVASYSSWWMPKAERTEHRQDILYALTQARWAARSRHAWGLLKSSPRAGLRARRYHVRLSAAVTADQ